MAELTEQPLPDGATGLGKLSAHFAQQDPKQVRRELAQAHGAAVDEDRRLRETDKRLLTELIPPRFRDAAIESFESATESQRVALAATIAFGEKAMAGDPVMLALIGKQGTGKSHLLYAIARRFLDHRLSFYARPWYRLADELRFGGTSAFYSGKSLEAREVRHQLWSQRVSLLDDIRLTASTAFDDTELAKFACHAYDANLAVLITTNVSPLSDVMGPAAASRFVQVTIDGPDRRQP